MKLEIDHEQAKSFLTSLFATELYGQIEIRAIASKKVERLWLYSISDFEKVSGRIEFLQNEGFNIFIGINPRRGKQGKSENIEFVNSLWLDLDHIDHTKETNLQSFRPKPSMVISSGNGLHAYWIFDKPQPVSSEISELLRALSSILDGDSVYDYPRVMRLPGTFNLKNPRNPKLCKIIINENNLRYTLSDFKDLLSGKDNYQPKSALEYNCSINSDDLPLSLRAKKLIRRGNDGTYHSRSEADMSVVIECVKKALSDEEIVKIFSDPANNIGEKFRAEGYHYMARTIRMAKKYVSDKFENNRLSKYSAKEARTLIIEALNTDIIFYQNQFYQYEEGYYKPILRLNIQKHISDILGSKISKNRLDEQLKLIEVELGVTHIPQNDDLWCFKNGTFSLKRNKLEAHSPDHFLFNSYPYNYEPFATCPTFMNFLDQILLHNKPVINFIQQILGYCLTWDVSHQVMFFFYGSGENGKSTLLEVFREIAGRNSTLEHRLNIFNDARETHLLVGKKLLIAGEMSEDEVIATERLKNAISGETIVSNPKYRDPFRFRSKLKIIVSTNHFPFFRDKTVGMKRRVLVIPFNAMIPVHQRKLDFFQKELVPELPGIFNFALDGLRRLQKGIFVVPKEVTRLSETKFRSRDSLSEFVHQSCELGSTYKVEVSHFYSKYLKFCTTNKLDSSPKNMVGKGLKVIDPRIKRKQKTKLKKNDTAIYICIKVA